MKSIIVCMCVMLSVLMAPTYVVAEAPAVKATITQRGLSYFMNAGVTVLEESLQNFPIPEINGTVPVIGFNYQYWITNTQLSKLSLLNDQLLINATDDGLDVILPSVAMEVTTDWKYREVAWPHISSSGSAAVTVNKSSVTLSLVLGETNGRISIASYKVTIVLGELNIRLHGGASWFLQIFEDIFNKKIKEEVQKAILEQASLQIANKLEPLLSTIPVIVPIDALFEIHYELVAPVKMTSDYLTIPDKGEFFAIDNQTEAPYTPGSLPDIVPSYENNMLQIIVDQYTFESLCLSIYNSKVLEKLIVDSDLPASAPLRLNTTYFQDLIPPLYTAYPDMMMELYAYASRAPSFSISESGATVKAEADIAFIVLPSNQTAFVLNVVFALSALADVKGTNLTGTLTYDSASLSILSTNIGTFDVSALDDILVSALQLGVIPEANSKLSTGFALPSVDGLSFVNATVVNYEGYLLVSTDASISSL